MRPAIDGLNGTGDMMVHTVEEAKAWAEENAERLQAGMLACASLPKHMKGDWFQPMWNAGEWLDKVLTEHGATHDERSKICFVSGQRSCGRDTFEVAVALANEFAASGTTKDRPGVKLAEEICREMGII